MQKSSSATLIRFAIVLASAAITIGVNAQSPGLKDLASEKGIYYGTTVDPAPDWLEGSKSASSNYTSLVISQFNSVTTGNTLKWDAIEGTQGVLNFKDGDQIVNFAKNHNQVIRGHTLVWYNQLPSWLTSQSWTASELSSILEDHIKTEVSRYKGVIQIWDVVNEAFNDDGSFRSSDSIWFKTLGKSYIADSFKWANAADPSAKLYINDYNTEGVNAKSNALLSLVKELLADSVPIHGVGFQSHFVAGQVPSDLKTNMQRFADLGLDVSITELDVRVDLPSTAASRAQQATDYASVTKTCLAISRCVGVTVWGFYDGNSWVPSVFSGQGDATLYDTSFSPKAAYNSVRTALGLSSTTTTAANIVASSTTTKKSTKAATSSPTTTTTTTKAAASSSKTTTTTAKAAASSSKTTTTTTKAAASSSKKTTTTAANLVASTTTTKKSTATNCANKWEQCGGHSPDYTGPTCCVSGTTCTYGNDYYSQCL